MHRRLASSSEGKGYKMGPLFVPAGYLLTFTDLGGLASGFQEVNHLIDCSYQTTLPDSCLTLIQQLEHKKKNQVDKKKRSNKRNEL